jgi:hypothetical protein
VGTHDCDAARARRLRCTPAPPISVISP